MVYECVNLIMCEVGAVVGVAAFNKLKICIYIYLQNRISFLKQKKLRVNIQNKEFGVRATHIKPDHTTTKNKGEGRVLL